MSAKTDIDLTSLADRLHSAGVYDEFCAVMFDTTPTPHYDDLLEHLEKWGVSSSAGALSRFKASHRGPWSLVRANREERAFLENQGLELDEATRKVVAMRIYMDAASPNTSTKDVLRMAELEVQKAKLQQDAVKLKQAQTKLEQAQTQIDLQIRRIEALELQAAAAVEAAKKTKEALKSGGMDETTRQQLMLEMDRMILGKVPEKKPTA